MTRLFTNDDTQIGEIGQTRTIADVFHDNGSEINPDAIGELQRILTYLKKYNTMIMLVTAHSNKHENRTESFKLSNERANKIVDFLVKNGIEKERLSFNGLGHDVLANQTGPEDRNEIGKAGIASSVEFKVISH
jgi:outer membrane protein OmpA-like peptidoglycan-associated protein